MGAAGLGRELFHLGPRAENLMSEVGKTLADPVPKKLGSWGFV